MGIPDFLRAEKGGCDIGTASGAHAAAGGPPALSGTQMHPVAVADIEKPMPEDALPWMASLLSIICLWGPPSGPSGRRWAAIRNAGG